MLDQEEIGRQQKLLETHRRTLAHYIRQQAALGFLAPPGVTHGIHEAREDIRRIKTILRERDVVVEDHPDDEPHFLPSSQSNSVAALLAGIFALVGAVAGAAALVQLTRYSSDPLTFMLPAIIVGMVWIGCIFVAFRSAKYFFYAWAGAIGIPLISAIILGLNRLLDYGYDPFTYALLAIGAGGGTLICLYFAITSKEVRRHALSKALEKSKAYNNRGIAYTRKRAYDNAITDFTFSIRLEPDVASTYYNRGNTYAQMTDKDKAIADFKKVLELRHVSNDRP